MSVPVLLLREGKRSVPCSERNLHPQISFLGEMMGTAPTERVFCCHLLKREAQVSMRTLFDINKQPGQFQELHYRKDTSIKGG